MFMVRRVSIGVRVPKGRRPVSWSAARIFMFHSACSFREAVLSRAEAGGFLLEIYLLYFLFNRSIRISRGEK